MLSALIPIVVTLPEKGRLFPVKELDMVTVNAHCLKSMHALMCRLMLQGRKTPTSNQHLFCVKLTKMYFFKSLQLKRHIQKHKGRLGLNVVCSYSNHSDMT